MDDLQLNTDKRVFACIGEICVKMSFADVQIDSLIELYLGERVGRIVLSDLGPQKSKSTLLQRLAEASKDDIKFINLIGSCMRAYNILRENRNKLAHAYAISELPDELRLHRSARKVFPPHAGIVITIEMLIKMLSDIRSLNGSLAMALAYRAQEMGYQFFAGSIKVGIPEHPIAPDRFPEIEEADLIADLWTIGRRATAPRDGTE